MAIWDIAIVNTNSGGDFTMAGSDLAVVKSIENAVYLAMFGGNIEADTKFPRPEIDKSWWGNALLLGQLPNAQFNSLTERTLNTTTLNSNGAQAIQNAIKKDLAFLAPQGSVFTVTVNIVSTDRINVGLRITMPVGAEKTASFAFVTNALTGDFDLTDFDFSDFF